MNDSDAPDHAPDHEPDTEPFATPESHPDLPLEELEDDEDVPPRPEETVADAPEGV